MATAFSAPAVRGVSYETIFGGATDGLAVGITLPSENEINHGSGRPNMAGSLKWIDDPELTKLSGPYAHFGVTQPDWNQHVDGKRRQIIINVQVYGDKNRIMSMAGKTIVGKVEIIEKQTDFGSFILLNVFEGDLKAEAAIELTSSTKNFTAEDGWTSFSTEAMAQVRIAVKDL
jgi:hypothetical protein